MLNYIIKFKSDRNQEVEVKEIEEVMEMDFGMLSVTIEPQTKMRENKSPLHYAAATEMNKFYTITLKTELWER